MGAGDKMAKGGCACCGMQKEGASHDMKQKPMGMMQDMPGSGQAGMCMPGMDDQKKGGCSCCDMQKMDKSGCACCGAGNKEMSSDMHQKHMGMHHKNVPAQTTAN
ncbi:hypothetical protein [Noviherbaspirillum sp.]|uniref:hypothetical protein n=1 Tax=Noviherbaspirillum sp. TaxID=1926288 RepID=UPI002FE12009